MRAFNQIVIFLFALLVCVFAQDSSASDYDTTVYVTSTVYRVNTVTVSGSHTGDSQNQTSTISGAYATGPANATTSKPTGTATQPPASSFTGAASSLNVNAVVAALAAGVAFLAL